jgi:serine/threonine protein kinase
MSGAQGLERLGKYEIRTTLGRGAMGTVYEAWDPVIARKVAIKTVSLPDAGDDSAQDELARFQREAQAAGRLNHPNIVGVFDYGEAHGLAYIVMEFVDGHTLRSVIEKQERFALPEIVRLMNELMAGLQFSHDRGVVHRDIKPANLILTADGKLKIADFGIARIESSSMTQAGTVLGTPTYMSPEQFMGQTVDLRTDIYSSGVLLYQLLTGERPFEGSMVAIMHKALNTVPPAPSELSVTVPPSFDPVVARAMAKRPEHRYASASEFAAAIHAALDGAADLLAGTAPVSVDATVVARPAPTPRAAAAPPPAAVPVPKKASRVPLFAGLAAVVIVAIGGAFWFVSRPAPPEQTASITPVIAPPQVTTPPSPPAPSPPASSPPASSQSLSSPPASSQSANTVPSPVPATPPPSVTAPPKPLVASQASNLVRPGSALVTPLPPLTAPPTPPAATPATTVAPSRPSPASAAPPPLLAAPPVPPAALPPAATATPAAPPEAAKPALVLPPEPASSQTPPVTAPVSVAPPPDTAAAPPPPPAPAVTQAAVRSAIAAAIAPIRCALVDGDVAADGSVQLKGLVERGAPDAALRSGVAGAAPGAALDWRVASFDGPYCHAVDILRPMAAHFGAPAAGFSIGLLNGKTQLADGDLIVLGTVLPDFPAQLQVDYLQHDGTVFHMHPAAADPARLYPANSRKTFGEPGPGFSGWQVGEPYGTDMIIAVASSAPLFTQRRPGEEPSEPYLRELQAAIETARKRGVRLAADALVLDTAAKR